MPLSNRCPRWKFQQARRFRKNQTAAEKIVWGLIRRRQLGFKVHRQKVIAGWIADFYVPGLKFLIEIDGDTHNAEKDQWRDDILLHYGYRTLRIKNAEVFQSPALVAIRIKEFVGP